MRLGVAETAKIIAPGDRENFIATQEGHKGQRRQRPIVVRFISQERNETEMTAVPFNSPLAIVLTMLVFSPARAESPRPFKIEDMADLMDLSPNGKWICLGINIHEIDSGKRVASLDRGSESRTIAIRFSADSKHVAACGRDGIVSVWETDNWKLVATLKGEDPTWGHPEYDTIAFSPDGQLLVAVGDLTYLDIWDVKTKKHVRRVEPRGRHAGVLTNNDAAFTPDGKLFVASGRNAILIFDTLTWKVTSQLPVPISDLGVVSRLAISPNSKWLANNDYDKERLRLWKRDGNTFRFEEAPDGQWGYYRALRFSADNRFLVLSGRDAAAVCELTESGVKLRYKYITRVPDVEGRAFGGAAFLADGRHLAILDDLELKYVDRAVFAGSK